VKTLKMTLFYELLKEKKREEKIYRSLVEVQSYWSNPREEKKRRSKDLSLKSKVITTLTKRQRQSFQGQKMSIANFNKIVVLQTPKQSQKCKQQQQKSRVTTTTTTSARLCFTIWFPLQHQREKTRDRTCLKTRESRKRKKKG
jgi:hypothetical protein